MKPIIPAIAALLFSAPLFAQGTVSFDDLDTDDSGSLTFEEVSAAGVTEEQFAQFDADGNSEWSSDEFATATSGSGSSEGSTTPDY